MSTFFFTLLSNSNSSSGGGSGEILTTENNLTSNTSNPNFTVSQRSTYSSESSYGAFKAMDGSTSTYSRTQYASGITDWWMIDFLTPVTLKEVTANFKNEGNYGTYLEASNDNSTWTRIDPTEYPGTTTITRTYDSLSAYRYYRMILTRTFYYVQIYEISFKYVK